MRSVTVTVRLFRELEFDHIAAGPLAEHRTE
jgi:hypothetical protein